ncbi:MAG: hypothetical protein C0392_03835 [Syntrophus sp. (in: bacteria)]|nr:hypothetical protein [Syntrophus sp. (in: bacteria)]
MIRIGHIDFINMIPLDIGDSDSALVFKKIKGVPSDVNRMLLHNEVDVAVISSTFYLEHKDELARIGTFGICSDGTVMSVLLFSNKELSQCSSHGILKVLETPQSATSLLLNRVILEHTYHLKKISVPTLEEADAVLMIGNDALQKSQNNEWPYVYDLGLEWKRLTGLPMVFAVLAANRHIMKEKGEEIEIYLRLLEKRYGESRKNPGMVVQKAMTLLPLSQELLSQYFACLSHEIGEREEQSLALFDTLIQKLRG